MWISQEASMFAETRVRLMVWGVLAASAGWAAEPTGWHAAGLAPKDYEMGVDRGATFQNKPSAYVRAVRAPKGFGTLMQTINVGRYRGSRVKLSADLKVERVEGWAGLWMRVDGREAK